MFPLSYYETEQELSMRIRGSVILHNNFPIYVKEVSKEKLLVRSLLTGDFKTLATKDKGFNLELPKLGYFLDSRGTAFYSARMPVRRFKQGLNTENVGIITNGLYTNIPKAFLLEKGFGKMLRNSYPSFEKALAEAQNPFKGARAFSKCFAVRGTTLFYKGSEVGSVLMGQPVLHPKFSHLRNMLEVAINA